MIWAIYAQVRRHARDHATGIGAGFSLANVYMSALHGLELCRHFKVTDRKDCIELCPVSMEEGGEKTSWENGLSLC